MATRAEADLTRKPGRPLGFWAHHPSDAWFFPTMVGSIWLLMLAGFVPEVIARANSDMRPYPLVIHAHALVFFGWLLFLASQVTLVRTGNIAWHRRMGLAGVVLAIAMIVLGPAAAFTMQMGHQTRQPPQFLAIQLINIIVFAGFIAAGLMNRHDPAAHKRLMLIGTMALIGAGFGRVVRLVTGGPAPFTLIPSVYTAANIMLAAIALYDYRTRGRLHPIFIPAAVVFVGSQLTAGLMLRSPAWIGFTHRLVG